MSVLCFTACSEISIKSQGQKKFGPDTNYFIGLKCLQAKNEKEAVLKFNSAAKKGSFYCAQESLRELCKIGSIQEKNSACLRLIKTFPSDENLLIAARQLHSADEISRLIEITENINIESTPNELIRLRLEAMCQRRDSRYLTQLFDWFTCRPLSSQHYDFYMNHIMKQDEISGAEEKMLSDDIDSLFEENFSEGNDDTEEPEEKKENCRLEDSLPIQQQDALALRILTYRRNYVQALEYSPKVTAAFEDASLPLLTQLCSDLGKAWFYGSSNLLSSAEYFKKLAVKYKNTSAEYYFWFYAGRSLEKLKDYKSSTKKCFKNAISTSLTAEQKDNAIWYLLDSTLQDSPDIIISTLEEYSRLWNDPYYFEDFFESLSPLLFASGNFDAFGKIAAVIDGYASDEVTGKYFYIFARLAEENLIQADKGQIRAAFERALKSGSNSFYELLAAQKLDLNPEETKKIIFNAYKLTPPEKDDEKALAARKLLEGYATFGFPELIYPYFMKLYKNGIPSESVFYICNFLQACGNENNDYFVQSIRCAARHIPYASRQLTENDFKYLYPLGFESAVNEAAQKYQIPNHLLFALIRSESFFKSDVKSHAGAIGLTQLMPMTGNDIARRLKISEYDLYDAKTNIEFGAYYFADLIRRSESNYLAAIFSYNAGITRVRKWLKGSLFGFSSKKLMPSDLFLETIPYAETREYGRKVASAAIMYNLIYDGNTDIFRIF